MPTDARETQAVKSCELAAELRTQVDQVTAKAQELYDSTCHPGLTELSGEIQEKAHQARVTARDLRTLADALDRETHDEHKALSHKIANERSSRSTVSPAPPPASAGCSSAWSTSPRSAALGRSTTGCTPLT